MTENKIIDEELMITTEDLRQEENLVYRRPVTLTDTPLHYCPGCGHGVAHNILMEVLDEMGLQGDTIGVAPVGCSVFAYHYMNVDMQQAPHGRACAVATGIKRVLPEKIVYTYQGDGDLAAIGGNETIHAANRGENFTIIFINNGIYGMTGGQMAPTTLPGMLSTTSPYGRDIETMGHPMKMTDIVATLPGSCYVTRQSVHTTRNVRKAKKAIQKAITYQQKKMGLSLVEIVSNCPSAWKMTPLEANKFVEEKMIPYYPLGDLKVPEEK